MNKLLKISQQTAYQLGGKLVSSVVSIIILGFVSRQFGESGTGIFTLATTYLGFFYLVADFGLNSHLLRNFLKDSFELDFKQLLGLRLILAFILVIVAAALITHLPFSSDTLVLSVRAGVLTILGVAVVISCNAVFQSKLKYNLSAACTALVGIPALLLILSGNLFKLTIPRLLFSYSLGYLLAALFGLFAVSKFVKNIVPYFDFHYVKTTLIKVWPIAATLAVNTIYFRVDSFILGSSKPLNEVGVYGLAYQIFQSALVLPTFITNSYYPLMLDKLEHKDRSWLKELKVVVLLMLALGVLACILTFGLSPAVIWLISGGGGFAGSIISLKILSLGFPAFFASSVLMLVLVALKKYKQMLVIYLVGLAINFLLNLYFIPQFSFLASSWITGFSEYLILILQICILIPTLVRL